jgi:hypothetical protein
MIEKRLAEISSQLADTLAIKNDILKRKEQISPGLKAQIDLLQQRQQAFKEALDLWRVVFKVYPNHPDNIR